MSSRKHQQYSGIGMFLGKSSGILIIYAVAIFIFATIVLIFWPAHSKPFTLDQAFKHPKPMLCEFHAFKKNPLFDKDAIFLSSCDFKAPWAKRTKN